MRKVIGWTIIFVSVGIGLFLHDRYIKTLIEIEEAQKPVVDPRAIEFINDQILPSKWPGDSIEVGGLSGLAWSSLNETLYAVSDDRGRSGPSRFYELQLSTDSSDKYQVQVKAAHSLKKKTAKEFAPRSLDPEGIALDSAGWIYISSEGDFKKSESAVPTILKLDSQGVLQFRRDFAQPFFPEKVKDRSKHYGIRYNLAFESLDIDTKSNLLVTTTESALIQDGEVSDFESGTQLRLAIFDVLKDSLSPKAHYIYDLSPIPSRKPVLKSQVGVTDLLFLSQDRFLVLERAYLGGRGQNRAKLFIADCSQAQDVSGLDSVMNLAVPVKKCSKKFFYDFDQLIGRLNSEHDRIDNLEGMAFGPKLGDSSRLLIVVSDNNFSKATQKTQFLFFKINLNNL